MCVRRELVCVERSHHPHNLSTTAFSISSKPHISHTDMVFYLVEASSEFTQVCCYHEVLYDCGFESLFIILCMPCYISLELSVESLVRFLSPYLSLTPYYTFELCIWLFVPLSIMCSESTNLVFTFFLKCFMKLCFVTEIIGHRLVGNANVNVAASYRV